MEYFHRKPPRLSHRQLELMAMVASNKSIAEAANESGITPSYAYALLTNAKEELLANNISTCIIRAHALGMLTDPNGDLVVNVKE